MRRPALYLGPRRLRPKRRRARARASTHGNLRDDAAGGRAVDQAVGAGHGAQSDMSGEKRIASGESNRLSPLKVNTLLKNVYAFDPTGAANAFPLIPPPTPRPVLPPPPAPRATGRDLIHPALGPPDFPTPAFIVEAAIKALRDGHHGYTPAVGITPLREAVAADLGKRFKVTVSPDEVMILPGGKPTMFMSILMFGEPGADILYPDPGFPIYRSMIEYSGARPVP